MWNTFWNTLLQYFHDWNWPAGLENTGYQQSRFIFSSRLQSPRNRLSLRLPSRINFVVIKKKVYTTQKIKGELKKKKKKKKDLEKI